MGIGGIWQWVLVLVIILLIFGTKRLRGVGSDLGHAVQGFRKSMTGAADEKEGKSEGHIEPGTSSSDKGGG